MLGRHVRLVGGVPAPPAPGPGAPGDDLAAVHDPHGAARDADAHGAADGRERDRVAHVADADVAVGRHPGPAPAADLVARRRRRQVRQPLERALVARRAAAGHLARVGPADPVAQAVVELAEAAEARPARGGDRPPPGHVDRPLGQALVPRPPDALGEDPAAVVPGEAPIGIIGPGDAGARPVGGRRTAAWHGHARNAADGLEGPHAPVLPAPHGHAGVAARPHPSGPRQAGDRHARLGPPARGSAGGPGDIPRPAYAGPLARLAREAGGGAGPPRPLREGLAEPGARARQPPRGGCGLAALGPHGPERRPGVPGPSLDQRRRVDLEARPVTTPGGRGECRGGVGPGHRLELPGADSAPPQEPRALARVPLAAADHRGHVGLAVPAPGVHGRHPPPLGHMHAPFCSGTPLAPSLKGSHMVPVRPKCRYHAHRMGGTITRYRSRYGIVPGDGLRRLLRYPVDCSDGRLA
ncbi:hypothetical protein IV77_GL001107 [Olsenella uli DSM 7084]|nr:hypothetical protein IV77_GL001107 [Olsenella uli DSM 7084]